MDHAEIRILDVDGSVTRDPSRPLPAVIPVQFNPTEYTLAKGANIAEIAIPGIDAPILQFVAGQTEKLTLDLFFDTTMEGGLGAGAKDVTERTRSIYQLVKVQPTTHAPPRVRFAWGQGLSFTAVVESVSQKFTLFAPNGVPLRATLSVTFREYKTLEEQLKELNLQSADHTRRHTVVQGDTLAGIAAREYGDAGAWRLIAAANAGRVPNPRRLTPGIDLVLPPADRTRGVRP